MRQQYKVLLSEIPTELIKPGMILIQHGKIFGFVSSVGSKPENSLRGGGEYIEYVYAYPYFGNKGGGYHYLFNFTYGLITCPKIGKVFGEKFINETAI